MSFLKLVGEYALYIGPVFGIILLLATEPREREATSSKRTPRYRSRPEAWRD